jgi:hypothetical protein
MTIPRFNRTYTLEIDIGERTEVIKPPLRISFEVDKSIRGSLNKARIQIYNMEERKRLALARDAEDQGARIPVRLSCGYQDRQELIFKGNIFTGSTERQGPDLVTIIESQDGGTDFQNSFTNRTVIGGDLSVNAILNDMVNTGIGKISPRPGLTRPKVLIGNSAELLNSLVALDESWYLENELLYIIKENELVSRFIPIVSAATGLISTPTRDSKMVTFQTLINPTVKIGVRVQLESTTAPFMNGIYKIETITYSGDNYGDAWSQTCTGQLGAGTVVL